MRRFGALSNDENNESKQKESSQKNINPYHSTPPTIIVAIIYNPIVNINPRKNISTLNELDRNWPITKAAKVIFAIPYNAEDKPLHWVELILSLVLIYHTYLLKVKDFLPMQQKGCDLKSALRRINPPAAGKLLHWD
jgi:hypothetical protein